MGFLKFLKREKKGDEFHELDLPPAPPPLDGFEEDEFKLPDLPDIDEKSLSEGNMPEFERPEKEEKLPDFPSFADFDEPAGLIPPVRVSQPMPSSVSRPLLGTGQEIPEAPQDARQKTGRGLFRHEQSLLMEKQEIGQTVKRGKTVYVRVDKFKAALGNINMVRNDLKKSDEALAKLENIKAAEEKSFAKMKSSIEDLQKKVIFIDKTLFKGE